MKQGVSTLLQNLLGLINSTQNDDPSTSRNKYPKAFSGTGFRSIESQIANKDSYQINGAFSTGARSSWR